MKLNLSSVQNAAQWNGVALPKYDVAKIHAETVRNPKWVHLGAGNLFRGYVARLQQDLLNAGLTDTGIVAIDTSADGMLTDRVYRPFDNLTLLVSLLADGSAKREVIASVAECVHADFADAAAVARLKEIFRNPALQMVSYTITEKGYSPAGDPGTPDAPANAMSKTAALLLERFSAGAYPVALVSMDNCSRNGDKLRGAVLSVAEGWVEKGLAPAAFTGYLKDEAKVAFPWSMIDKITPRPDAGVAANLAELGVEDMDIIPREKGAALAPFVNAETAEYLVIEDSFPNGRPPLEKAGVYMTRRETVNLSERMKVTVCLNPLHTSLAVLGCLLGYTRIWQEMKDPELLRLINRIGEEGLKVVEHPGIIDPAAFIKELLDERLPNPCIPDAPQRIACDTSAKVPVRYGETLKSYAAAGLPMDNLVGIPLTIAAWLRYLLAVDDKMRPMECSPDPRLAELQAKLPGVIPGKPETACDLSGILSDAALFGVDLTKTPLAAKVEMYFKSMLQGENAVRQTLADALK